MKVLVTGGAGFIGSHVCIELKRAGFDVLAIDNLERSSIEGLKRLESEGIPLMRLDLREAEIPSSADVIVHATAYIDVAESWERPFEYFVNNAAVTAKIAKLASRNNSLLIYISSAAVYGEPKYLPIDEDHPINPTSPYGISKLAGELAVRVFSPRATIVRPFNVYGPGQSSAYAGVITKFVENAVRGEPLVIFGDGLQTRDFVYVGDGARFIRVVIERQAQGVYNIGSGREISVLELAKLVMGLTGLAKEPIFKPPRPGDIRRSWADTRRALALGWSPQTSLEDGIKELIGLYEKKYREGLGDDYRVVRP